MYCLVACEESQIVTSAFRNVGVEAFSCDLQLPSGGHPEWHILGDCTNILTEPKFCVMSGKDYNLDAWDLIIAHPPCTYLTRAGARWFRDDLPGSQERKQLRERDAKFFEQFLHLPCPVAVENPIGYMNKIIGPPTQTIWPYWFGDPIRKRVCLWLRRLPPLYPTRYVEPELYVSLDGRIKSTWLKDTVSLPKEERSKQRSKFFPGIAAAMAAQWVDSPGTLF